MEPVKKTEQSQLTTQSKGTEINAIELSKRVGELYDSAYKESVKMYLCAMFEDMASFFKVPYKMEPKETAKMVMMIITHDTYKTYTIEQYNDFCNRVKMGTLKGSDGKPMKIFNRFDVPLVFEFLGSFNGEIEAKKELKSKDEKHEAINNTKKQVGGLFAIFDELAKQGYNTKVSDLSGVKKKVDKEKSREGLKHYNNFITLLELEEIKDGKILYEGQRIDSSTYIHLKTKP